MTMLFKKFPTATLIDGEWLSLAETFPVLDPARGKEIAAVPNLAAAEAIRAIDAAVRALPSWSAKTAKERATILKRWFDLITAETDSLAQLMTMEQGKPLAEARGEVAYGAAFIEWFAEEGKRAYGRTIPTTVASKRYITIKQPIGVVAAITPWNFSIAMITRKAAPALASGCTIVVKPAAETPLCALAIAKLALDAGVPPGVLNIVTSMDAPAIGKVFCDDPRVRKLSFTGSTEVGKILYRQCADTVKKLTLELGGNAPIVMLDDAIAIGNDTPFGPAAYLFSDNLSRAWRMAEQLDAGMVGVNEGIFSNEAVPFGGVKESGLGREGSAEGLEEYLETKYICLGTIDR
jgi:succinate-semialdehyde dehydrogenase/glutarate-semialdehyde dehydrogenase